jgi:hypothetical protein
MARLPRTHKPQVIQVSGGMRTVLHLGICCLLTKYPDKERVEHVRCVLNYFSAIQTEDLGSPGCTMKQILRKERKANMIDEPADMSCAKGMW